VKLKIDKYILSIQIALGAVFDNKIRSILTALGIIFGVAAVIAMLAIGNGAKSEILEQMKLVGVNNIVITPVFSDDKNEGDDEEESTDEQEKESKEKLSQGLNLQEALSIKNMIPSVIKVSPEVINKTQIIFQDKGVSGTFTGITHDYFDIYNLELEHGSFFSDFQYQNAKQVCIIGHNIKSKLFPTESALGKQIKCGDVWLTIVGVLKSHGVGNDQTADLKLSDFNMNVYAPLETVLLRFNDRSIITKKSLKGRRRRSSSGGGTQQNRNQLDKIVVQVAETAQLKSTASILNKMLSRRHSGAKDYQITVPELLLKQEQKTRSIFNLVLGAIASISLIVGGIGIMNIMLASVMERIREIGVRRAIGATQKDIIFQFLSEAILISVSGGIVGIILGVSIAQLITRFTEIPTIISSFSIVISFGVSAGIGVIFGYMPAKKAAIQDPVTSLRHE